MEKVKSEKDYSIFKKRNGRYGVKASTGKWINGEDKVKILSEQKLIQLSPKKKIEEPKEETTNSEAPEA